MGRGVSEPDFEGVIPPSEGGAKDEWFLSDKLPRIPRQDLLREEAEAFLEYVFGAVARRPRRLSLREGARVVRYLHALAWEMKPGPIRELLDRFRDVVWGTLRQFGEFEPSDKAEAIQFLERHAGTYLAGLNVEAALARVRESAPPRRYGALFQPPHLMSRFLSHSGRGDPHLREYLTERIFASYHALRRAGVRNARGRVAEALNRQELQTRARAETATGWGGYEVHERVRQYEERWKKQNTGREGTVEGWRDSVVDKWVYLFHSRMPATKGKAEGNSESGEEERGPG